MPQDKHLKYYLEVLLPLNQADMLFLSVGITYSGCSRCSFVVLLETPSLQMIEWSSQSRGFSDANILSVCFKVLLKRSTKPSEFGIYGVVLVLCIPNLAQIRVNNSDSNYLP